MPILEITNSAIKQECIVCGAVHTIPLKQGVAKAKKGPYALSNGDTLDVKVDGQPNSQVVPFVSGDFASIAAATAAEVAAKINSRVTGAVADVDGNAVRIVSASSALTSAVEISGGSARDKLGFDGRRYGPRVLGVTIGTGAAKKTAPDTMDLPHCPDCGSKECLIRTWDTAPPEVADSPHAIHRRHVNALAQRMKADGFSDADAKVKHDTETFGPPDTIPNFPPNPNVPLPSMRRPPRDSPGRP
jgi:hypothetical protein